MFFRRVYAFLGGTIAVASDQTAVLDWLDEFLTPAFDRRDHAPGDVTVTIRTDGAGYARLLATRPVGPLPDAPCFALDQRVSRRPQWTADGRIVLHDLRYDALYVIAGREVEIHAAGNAPHFRTGAMRVICEIAAARALGGAQRLQVHAAALDFDGRGLLIAGPKTSGKTTLLARLAASTGAGIMSNDRSLLSFDSDGIEVRAVPTTVKIRPFTVECMPGVFPTAPSPLQAFLTLAEVAAGAGGDGTADPGGDLKLSPAQFARALDARLAARARLAAVAFPEHHDDASGVALARLTPADAEQRLLRARFGLHSGKTGPTVFEQCTAASRPGDADARLIAQLAAAVPCFAVRIGAAAYGRTATVERVVNTILA